MPPNVVDDAEANVRVESAVVLLFPIIWLDAVADQDPVASPATCWLFPARSSTALAEDKPRTNALFGLNALLAPIWTVPAWMEVGPV